MRGVLAAAVMVAAAACGGTEAHLAVTAATAATIDTTITTVATAATRPPTTTTTAVTVAVVPAGEPFPRFDMSAGSDGTDFAAMVSEYARLIRWVYLHPGRLSEAEQYFMPEGPAYTYLQEVTGRFLERGWRVDLGEWEPIDDPLLVAGGSTTDGFVGMFVSYRKAEESPILDAATGSVVDMLPQFDRQTFQMSLRYRDGVWKVYRDEKPLAG
ncbi:MAG: hypothetical protein ACE5E8_03880 [Acidimicrobiia bacterium]